MVVVIVASATSSKCAVKILANEIMVTFAGHQGEALAFLTQSLIACLCAAKDFFVLRCPLLLLLLLRRREDRVPRLTQRV